MWKISQKQCILFKESAFLIVTPTYVRLANEIFDKRLHVCKLLSSLQQEQHIHRLLTWHCVQIGLKVSTG